MTSISLSALPGQAHALTEEARDPGSMTMDSVQLRLARGTTSVMVERAMQRLVRRHPALTARVVASSGRLVQVLEERAAITVQQSAADVQPADLAAALAELKREDTASPFALERDIGLRVRHVALRGGRSVLLLTAHQGWVDRPSLETIVDELRPLQTGAEADPAPGAPDGYAEVVRRIVGDPVVSRQAAAYWQERLRDTPAYGVPPSASLHDLRRAEIRWSASDRAVAALHAAARSAPSSAFEMLVGALGVTVADAYACRDVVLPVGVSLRRLEDVGVVGSFSSPIPVRLDLRRVRTLIDAAHVARTSLGEASTHARLPFEALTEALASGPWPIMSLEAEAAIGERDREADGRVSPVAEPRRSSRDDGASFIEITMQDSKPSATTARGAPRPRWFAELGPSRCTVRVRGLFDVGTVSSLLDGLEQTLLRGGGLHESAFAAVG